MRAEIISAIIFLGSVSGMIMMAWKKIPALVELKINDDILTIIKKKIKVKEKIKSISIENILQKHLSKIRILILKTDNKTSDWIAKLRQRSKKRKENVDDYWQKLKK